MAVAYARPRKTRARYGEGTIWRLRSGRWRWQLSAGFDPVTGARRRFGDIVDTRAEAIAQKTAALRQIAQGIAPVARASTDPTVGAWLDTWLARHEGGNSRTQDHRSDWTYYVRTHLGHVRLRQLTSDHVRDLVNKVLLTTAGRAGHILKPTSRHHVWALLHALLEAACRDDRVCLERNVASGVKVVGYRYDGYDARILSDEEYEAFLGAAVDEEAAIRRERAARGLLTPPMAAGLILLAENGIRFGELAGLLDRAIDLERRSVRIAQQAQRIRGQAAGSSRKADGSRIEIVRPKTRYGDRSLDLTDRGLHAIRAHREVLHDLTRRIGRENWSARGLFMPAIKGLVTQNRAFTDFFRRVCVRAGIVYRDREHPNGLRIHDLRHTYATEQVSQPGARRRTRDPLRVRGRRRTASRSCIARDSSAQRSLRG